MNLTDAVAFPTHSDPTSIQSATQVNDEDGMRGVNEAIPGYRIIVWHADEFMTYRCTGVRQGVPA